MTDGTPGIISTQLSDRDVLLHILTHVEALTELLVLLEEFRPLLALLKTPNGKLDMVGVMQARREAKRWRNGWRDGP